MTRAENRALVRSCIDQLPESYRTVLVLRDIEELDTEEAARVLGISGNAVKIRLHRARQALRTLLAPHFRSAQS
jgi:RNA polymerase sigma-70 factor (ECF subfamily)